ncbi:MAG: radical SAM protein [Candidatus Zixiibacteriota bacterium]|nr:MAG: radical SAM protein [candidate division Zixibacteria bacterium]
MNKKSPLEFSDIAKCISGLFCVALEASIDYPGNNEGDIQTVSPHNRITISKGTQLVLNPEIQAWQYHIKRHDWLVTPEGNPRGYIQPHSLRELWFHTGTRCNLGCWFCLEGAGPQVERLESLTFEDVRPLIDEAMALGVEQFCFTGGEPFVNHDIIAILEYALKNRPCLVLTNGTRPLRERMEEVRRLAGLSNKLRFRVSLDHPDRERHDEGRGHGSFALALESLIELRRAGFELSIARHITPDENAAEVNKQYRSIFRQTGLPLDTNIIPFPQLHRPFDRIETPHITENCMTTYKDETTRREFMCAYSKMVVKREGKVKVYACTLVDDDPDYDLGTTLHESMKFRIMLKHHRCYACFAAGACCSEN